jgi:hypothetical protein
MTIEPKTARNCLAAIVIGGIIVAVCSLLVASLGQAISPANVDFTLEHLAKLYGAPFAVICGFYFGTASRPASTSAPVANEPFILAILLMGIYALTPAVLVWVIPVERLLTLIDKAAPYGQSVSSLILAYFFSHYQTT